MVKVGKFCLDNGVRHSLSKKNGDGVPSPRHVLSMEAVTELRKCRAKVGSHPFEGGDYERDDES
jgi:hypothetical protein